VNLTSPGFAIGMAAPQAAATVATAACLWLFYWRRGRRGHARYSAPEVHVPRDRALFGIAAAACAAFVVLVLVGVPLVVSSLVCAGVLAVAFLIRDRSAFAWRMIPLRLLAFVTGLFLVVQTIDRYGLGRVLATAVVPTPGLRGSRVRLHWAPCCPMRSTTCRRMWPARQS
jgi:arsenical pump membrane protein